MRFPHALSLAAIGTCFCLPGNAYAQSAGVKAAMPGQTPYQAQAPSPTPAPSPSPGTGAPAAPAAPAPSSLVQPAVDSLQQTLGSLKLEKWKGGSVRNEASGNIQSIQRDVQDTLPGLLKETDAASGSLGSLLPVYRNLVALYDVVLRVYDAARVSGPADQVAALQQSMTGIEGARRSLHERMVAGAAAQEKQIAQLQTTLQTRSEAPACPVAAPAPPLPPAKKPMRKKKSATPATNPAGKTPATGAAPAKPTTPQ